MISRPCGFGAKMISSIKISIRAALIRWQVGILWEAPFPLNRKSVVRSFGYLEKTISQFVVSMGAVVARKNEKNKRGNSLIGKWRPKSSLIGKFDFPRQISQRLWNFEI